jgi:hypothetical protein
MTLRKRKLTVVIAVAAVIILANVWGIAALLDGAGVIRFADHIRREYLTGTAIAVIAVLLFLLTEPIGMVAGWVKRCRVCRRLLVGSAKYCGRCGSRV